MSTCFDSGLDGRGKHFHPKRFLRNLVIVIGKLLQFFCKLKRRWERFQLVIVKGQGLEFREVGYEVIIDDLEKVILHSQAVQPRVVSDLRWNLFEFVVIQRQCSHIHKILHPIRQLTDILTLYPKFSHLRYLHKLLTQFIKFIIDQAEFGEFLHLWQAIREIQNSTVFNLQSNQTDQVENLVGDGLDIGHLDIELLECTQVTDVFGELGVVSSKFEDLEILKVEDFIR